MRKNAIWTKSYKKKGGSPLSCGFPILRWILEHSRCLPMTIFLISKKANNFCEIKV